MQITWTTFSCKLFAKRVSCGSTERAASKMMNASLESYLITVHPNYNQSIPEINQHRTNSNPTDEHHPAFVRFSRRLRPRACEAEQQMCRSWRRSHCACD